MKRRQSFPTPAALAHQNRTTIGKSSPNYIRWPSSTEKTMCRARRSTNAAQNTDPSPENAHTQSCPEPVAPRAESKSRVLVEACALFKHPAERVGRVPAWHGGQEMR